MIPADARDGGGRPRRRYADRRNSLTGAAQAIPDLRENFWLCRDVTSNISFGPNRCRRKATYSNILINHAGFFDGAMMPAKKCARTRGDSGGSQMVPLLAVIDDFLPDPDAVRAHALSCRFVANASPFMPKRYAETNV